MGEKSLNLNRIKPFSFVFYFILMERDFKYFFKDIIIEGKL
jgi:hypothetical protein